MELQTHESPEGSVRNGANVTEASSQTFDDERLAECRLDRSPRPNLSIVIPVAATEDRWQHLLHDLESHFGSDVEVLIAGTELKSLDVRSSAIGPGFEARWVKTRPGRAAQMNDAARLAVGRWLWFLHADSRLTSEATSAVRREVESSSDGLRYFGLRFYDGPRWLRLNEWGIAFRCRIFGLPFGDQGFCLPRETFLRLGGFPESAAFGEDHLLVWKVRRRSIPLRRLRATIETSGRKYAFNGWFRTTARHLWLTVRQALPEAMRR